MKDIVIVANFCDGPNENTNNRFNYLANMFSNQGNKVELITSNFSHRDKCRRVEDKKYNRIYKLTMLNEPTYFKNISLLRFYAHFKFSRNVKRYLKNRKKPDLIYCAIPSLDVGSAVARYAKKNNIKLIIDIQDLWPEAFKMIFNIDFISNIIFYPINSKANKIYRSADKIIAVSKTYKERAIKVSNKDKDGLTVFLGTDLNEFDRLAIEYKKKKKEDEFWITYVGTLGHSYNIKSVIDALSIINDNGVENIKFIIIGDGPLKNDFESYALKRGVNCKFTGKLNYGEMVGLLVQSDLAVNPITKGAAQSIINKHADYVAAGLPILSTQDNIEFINIINNYKIGLNCKNDNINQLANNILKLYNDSDTRRKMGINSRYLAESKFNRANSYKEILTLIEKL